MFKLFEVALQIPGDFRENVWQVRDEIRELGIISNGTAVVIAAMLKNVLTLLLWQLLQWITVVVIVKGGKMDEGTAKLVNRACPALKVLGEIDHFFVGYRCA